MLDFLRNKKDSWIIKIILGVIILAFVIFFGSDTLRQGSGNPYASPAKVNGVEINRIQFEREALTLADRYGIDLNNHKEEDQQKHDFIFQMALNNLIQEELVLQDIKKLGLKTSKKELQNFILKDPNTFDPETNKFDFEWYRQEFLPDYKLRFGISYEKNISDNLLLQKLTSAIQKITASLNQSSEIKQTYFLQNTKYNFSVIRVSQHPDPKKEKLPKDIKETDEAPVFKDKATQKKLADQIFANWKKNQDITALLKKNDLRKKNTGELSLVQLKSVFDGQENLEDIKILINLSEKSPFPENYFTFDNFYYLVKLEKYIAPEKDPLDVELSTIKTTLSDQITDGLYSAWIQYLQKNAKIKQM